MMAKSEEIDKTNVMIISHIHIRDPDTGETILRKRDKNIEKASQENGPTDR